MSNKLSFYKDFDLEEEQVESITTQMPDNMFKHDFENELDNEPDEIFITRTNEEMEKYLKNMKYRLETEETELIHQKYHEVYLELGELFNKYSIKIKSRAKRAKRLNI